MQWTLEKEQLAVKFQLHKFTEKKSRARWSYTKTNRTRTTKRHRSEAKIKLFPEIGLCVVFLIFFFFRNIFMLRYLGQSIRSKMLFLLFNYGFLLGWFFFSSRLCQQISIICQAANDIPRKRARISTTKKKTFKKNSKFFRLPKLCAGATEIYRLEYHFYSNYESFSSICLLLLLFSISLQYPM